MTTCRLDELAGVLQSTLDRAQEEIDQQHAKRLSRVIKLNRQGEPEYLSWECRLPAGDGSERNLQLLQLPWASLTHSETLEISELSIEVAFRIGKTPSRKVEDSSFTVTPVNRKSSPKDTTHQLKLSVNRQKPWANVTIDGEDIEQFPIEQLTEQMEKKCKRQRRWAVLIILALLGLTAAAAFFLGYF